MGDTTKLTIWDKAKLAAMALFALAAILLSINAEAATKTVRCARGEGRVTCSTTDVAPVGRSVSSPVAVNGVTVDARPAEGDPLVGSGPSNKLILETPAGTPPVVVTDFRHLDDANRAAEELDRWLNASEPASFELVTERPGSLPSFVGAVAFNALLLIGLGTCLILLTGLVAWVLAMPVTSRLRRRRGPSATLSRGAGG